MISRAHTFLHNNEVEVIQRWCANSLISDVIGSTLMAQVRRKGDILMVSWITGPQHLWLGVKFAREFVEPTVVKHPPIGNCFHGEIAESQLVAAVLDGSQEFGLYPERIEYVENDSPAYGLYAHCARLLAEYATKEEA